MALRQAAADANAVAVSVSHAKIVDCQTHSPPMDMFICKTTSANNHSVISQSSNLSILQIACLFCRQTQLGRDEIAAAATNTRITSLYATLNWNAWLAFDLAPLYITKIITTAKKTVLWQHLKHFPWHFRHVLWGWLPSVYLSICLSLRQTTASFAAYLSLCIFIHVFSISIITFALLYGIRNQLWNWLKILNIISFSYCMPAIITIIICILCNFTVGVQRMNQATLLLQK